VFFLNGCNGYLDDGVNRTGMAAETMSDQELVELVLDHDSGTPAVKELSESIFSHFAGRAFSPVSADEIRSFCGLAPDAAARLSASIELARRLLKPDDAGGPIRSPRDACRLVTHIREKKKEYFIALYLNSRNILVHEATISIGSLNANIVHPREVFRPAIVQAAASVVLAHNHPSGDVTPSQEDLKLTMRMVEAGRLIGIEVLDHIIISETGYLSFRSESYL
jgi:DNA repair protein RadC